MWKSKLQKSVALSAAEIEYIALSDCTRSVISAMNLTTEVLGTCTRPTTIQVDNKAAIAVAEGCATTMTHVDVHQHFGRQCVERGDTRLHWCETTDMVADMFTKPLSRGKLERLRSHLGLKPPMAISSVEDGDNSSEDRDHLPAEGDC